jgi:hypothetical protein
VEEITFLFNEAVTGFDLGDLTLSRSAGTTVSLLPGAATLTTADNVTWILGNVGPLTGGSGIYELRVAAGGGVQDVGGNPMTEGATEKWVNGAGDANEDGAFDQLDVIAVLQGAKYLSGQPASWSEGDWNGDRLVDQFDIILSQQTSPPHYLQGPFRAATADGPAADSPVSSRAAPAPGAADAVWEAALDAALAGLLL